MTNKTTPRLEALRRERPLAERPEIIEAEAALARARVALPLAAAEVEQAEQQLADAEAAAAERDGDIDQRPLTQARRRVEDARSTHRVRQAALTQAEVKLKKVSDSAHEAVRARVQEVYQDRLEVFDAAIAGAAAVNAELAEIARIARTLLPGASANPFVYFAPLGSEAECHYIRWRNLLTTQGFVLPPPSPSHVLPSTAVRLPSSADRSGFSNAHMRPQVLEVPLGPGGQPLSPRPDHDEVPLGRRVW